MLDGFNEWTSKILLKFFGSRNERLLKEIWPIVEKINGLEPEFKKIKDDDLVKKTKEFQERYKKGETLDDLLPEAFALAREGAFRTIGLRHYDVQMIGGIVLHQGKIAEMITGEGKTLVATSAAYLNTLSGKKVHVITVNDYLAKRDSEWMGPVYRKLGVSVGCIQSDMDPITRQKEYACNITYGTNNEFGFDYLRDNMKVHKEEQCQGELSYTIIDEVDSVLIDEARTPLIISGPAEESTDKYYKANQIAKKLKKNVHYEIKEKEQLVLLTEEGIDKAEKLAGVDSFYKGKNMDWPHHINQALRAHNFFSIDKEYVIKDGQIVIVDEFTGRLQPGRRWSDGLHQAIEAKESLTIQEENQTLATITFQNFFRLYTKLAGMTGTAMTEAMEFDNIYKLDVVAIPPNRTLTRKAYDDVIYGTMPEKFKAIIEETAFYNKIGRPILVGTISIEVSEYLSSLLERKGVEHEVLNAKYHEKEAQIITNAGQLGHVTIATNMAGRGTDIVLGKFTKQELLDHWKSKRLAPKKLKLEDKDIEEKLLRHWGKIFLEQEDENTPLETLQKELNSCWEERGLAPLKLCENVADLGGLHIIGSERHDSRRIDNQLRGRSGRQGDPGSSRFFLSFDDELLRKFAPPTMVNLMKKMGMQNGQDIRHPMISRGINKAQQKVEQFNFEIRKSLLDFDEVMDEQRKIVYDQRQKVLENNDVEDIIWKMLEENIYDALDRYLPPGASIKEWDFKALVDWIKYKFNLKIDQEQIYNADDKKVTDNLFNIMKSYYKERTKILGNDMMRALERYLLLEAIDSKWKDHLYAMDELKAGINLVAMAQKDPKIEYKRNGYRMFDEMIVAVREEVTDLLFKLEFEQSDVEMLDNIWQPAQFSHQDAGNYGGMDRDAWDQAQVSASGPVKVATIKRDHAKVGRNDPCPCGSGKKYKKCCGKN